MAGGKPIQTVAITDGDRTINVNPREASAYVASGKWTRVDAPVVDAPPQDDRAEQWRAAELTVPDLRAICDDNNLAIANGAKKDEIIALLVAKGIEVPPTE